MIIIVTYSFVWRKIHITNSSWIYDHETTDVYFLKIQAPIVIKATMNLCMC
jgi:hypothetical protein